MKATSMAKTSIEIYKRIDQLTKKQQVQHDLPFLVKYYWVMKEHGIKDSLIVELFDLGLLETAWKGIVNEIGKDKLCQ